MTRAVHRDEQAWAAIIERFGPLVAAVLRRYRLTHADVQETTQAVWLKLFENLHKVREPAALPGWIATTTQRQALQTIRRGARVRCVESIESVVDGLPCADQRTGPDDQLLQAERRRAVRDGLAELTAEQRELLLLVVADPPVSYREISERLKIPMGSIGPTRARHLLRPIILRTASVLLKCLDGGPDPGSRLRIGLAAFERAGVVIKKQPGGCQGCRVRGIQILDHRGNRATHA